MKIQKYLISNELVREEQLLLFSLRSKCFQVKSNFKYLHDNDLTCRACHEEGSIEDEIHICKSCPLFINERGDTSLNFEDVFGSLDDQILFIKRFKVIARKWKLLLDLSISTI